jgi:hypothetical protein
MNNLETNNYCYSCKEIIASYNRSQEHIIPNSIGGQIKSDKLLCKSCNENFGNGIDKILNNQLGFFGVLLNIKRDRTPEKLYVKGEYDTGEVRYVGTGMKGGYKIIIPVKKNDIIEYVDIYPKTEQEFNRLKKQQEKSLKKIFKDIKTEEYSEYNEKKLLFSTEKNPITIGGNDFFRAICKIVVNFYISQGGILNQVSGLIDFISNNNNVAKSIFYYPDLEILQREPDEIAYIIYIQGDSKEKIAYSYIELFSSHCIWVNIDENYKGVDFEFKYCYDLINEKEIQKKLDLQFTTETFISTFNPMLYGHYQARHNDLIKRFFSIIERKQNDLKNR